MKIYHVETQQDYDELMIELEEKGCKWLSGRKLTGYNYWKSYKENTCIVILAKYITFMNIEQSKRQHPNIPIIEYKAKAKGENMTQEENKHNLQKIAFDVSVAIESFARDISESEADLQEAKSSAKKLIEKIDEYLETSKPEFKVGDIVSSEILTDGCGIVRLEEDLTYESSEIHGIWYTNNDCEIQEVAFTMFKQDTRHATPTEIAEYEAALTFLKHDRKPFELKNGDLIRTPSEKITFILNPENYAKEDFLKYGWEFLKAAEEVSEWLENK